MSLGITSTISGVNTVYVVTDGAGNTVTVTAQPVPGGLSFSSSGNLLADGQILLQTLTRLLTTGLRPNVLINTAASFTS